MMRNDHNRKIPTFGWLLWLASLSSSMSSSVSVSGLSGCLLLLLSHCSMSLQVWLRHWPIVDMILKSYHRHEARKMVSSAGWAGSRDISWCGPGHQAGDSPVTHNKWIFRCHTGHCLNHIKFAIVSLLTLRHESRQPGSYLASNKTKYTLNIPQQTLPHINGRKVLIRFGKTFLFYPF